MKEDPHRDEVLINKFKKQCNPLPLKKGGPDKLTKLYDYFVDTRINMQKNWWKDGSSTRIFKVDIYYKNYEQAANAMFNHINEKEDACQLFLTNSNYRCARFYNRLLWGSYDDLYCGFFK
ncbi:unnamed protein product [Cylicocyclus nassatus]|uniref:Uncharacterized protein n=1 Tax=Cylicocyclus nassatus TaxID=53992 RepID=A0AA36DS09_CYLNA|nr:unnamed protein product [Cylicocyclus nassatus]